MCTSKRVCVWLNECVHACKRVYYLPLMSWRYTGADGAPSQLIFRPKCWFVRLCVHKAVINWKRKLEAMPHYNKILQ